MLATGIAFISTIFRVSDLVGFTFSRTGQVLLTFFTFVIFLLLWEVFSRIHEALNKRLPFAKNFIKRFVVQFLCNWLVLVVMRWTVFYYIVDYLPIELNILNYIMLLSIDVISAAGLTLAFAASHFFVRWKHSLIKSELLEKEKAQMQIHNLRNRVNPHFLFNALSALDGLIKTQPELASNFLQHLSKVYRYSLQNEDRESVSLDKEFSVFKHFVSLLEIRYGKSLQIDIHFSSDALDKGIVPLTLEMLTENALKHNEITEAHPLQIYIYNNDEMLIVENTLQIKKTMETSNNKGLIQLRNLYAHLSDIPFEADVQGDLFVVKLPLL